QRSTFQAVVTRGRVLVPSFDADVELPRPVHRALKADPSTGLKLHLAQEVTPAGRKKWSGKVGIVALGAEETPAVGTLSRLGGRGHADITDPYPGALRGRLVKVTALERSGPSLVATVEALIRPGRKVSARDLEVVKEAFAAYAKRDDAYRAAVSQP